MERQAERPGTLADFLGCWQMVRTVQDHRTGGDVLFHGQAVWRGDGASAQCTEAGVMQMAGQPDMAATRRYGWQGAGPRITVRFEDGRLFHTIALDRAQPQARHLCGEDLYEAAYDFRHWPDWRCRWTVTGPRKNYVMVTAYRQRQKL